MQLANMLVVTSLERLDILQGAANELAGPIAPFFIFSLTAHSGNLYSSYEVITKAIWRPSMEVIGNDGN